MGVTIAVDLGGTHLRVALFTKPSPPAAQQVRIPTAAHEGPLAVISRMKQSIQQLIPAGEKDVRIGVGSPGPLNPFRGVVLSTPNLPGWENVPLRQLLAEHFHCPVALGNDAVLAALGEWHYGAGRGVRNLLYLTISTGIGGGAIVDGKPLFGANGLAPEFGHMFVVEDGPQCGCGQHGHLEAIASGTAIARLARQRLEGGEQSTLLEMLRTKGAITAKDVGDAACAGDALAIEEIARAASAIGKHLASLVHAFNPEAIILGGGVTKVGGLFFDPLRQSVTTHLMHTAFADGLHILPAELGDDAGLIGAMIIGNEA
jgi:glucokinase